MSSGVDVQRRPAIWSYFSFGSSNSTPRRRTSSLSGGTLPTRYNADPFEKAGRHNQRPTVSFMKDFNLSQMNQGQRSRYLKTGGLIAFVLLVIWFIAPRSGSGPFPGGDVASDPSVGTDRCSKSFSSHKPLVQYALMIDAGSTGSRIHVYRFNNCGPTPDLEDELFVQTEKKAGGSGLSSYKEDAEGAAKSLDVLMEAALKAVPEKLQGCSPIAVKATAGLRKLGQEMSDKILAAVRHRLETAYPFPVVAESKNGVEVMEGVDEAVYAWITVNYLIGKIGGPDRSPTGAVLDLGGGSTQIVFEPTFKSAPNGGMPEKLSEGDHKYMLDFGGREFSLYQHSYLGYGLMEARNTLYVRVLDTLYEEHKESKSTAWLEKPILNPCFVPGMSESVKIELPKDHPLTSVGAILNVNMTGPTTGSPLQCRYLAEHILLKDADCKLSPCSFNGVHQPPFAKVFASEDVYLLSYFFDRMEPLGMPSSFTISELKDMAQRVCDGEASGNWDVFSSVPGALEELKGRPEYCLDLNFMVALLHTGYEMPIDREVKIAKKIKNFELGWALGASLPLLNQESGWKCKIKQVA